MAWDNMSKKVIKLVKRDGTKCHYCKRELNFTDPTSGRFRTVDHKKSQSEDGGNSLDNLVLACWGCNQKKGDKDYDTFVAMLKHQKQHQKQQKRLAQQRSRQRKSLRNRKE